MRLSGFTVCTRLEVAIQKRRKLLETGTLATEKKDNRLPVSEWGERENTKGKDNH